MLDDALPVSQPAQPAQNTTAADWEIPWEWFAYGLLFIIVFVLRFAELDTVLPRSGEIPNFLAAWRDQPISSPLLFWAQRIGFGMIGGTVLAARLLTAAAGIAVVFSPTMFRNELGRGRAFMLTVLLAVLPPLFIASRTTEAVVWTLLVAAIASRLTLNAVQTGKKSAWTAAIAGLVALVLLTDPSGIFLAALLIFAMITAMVWDESDQHLEDEPLTPLDEDDTEPEISLTAWARTRAQLRTLPWESGLAVGALITLIVSTLFLTPSGLSNIGELLAGIAALFNTSTADNPIAAVIFYMPWTMILAVGAVWITSSEGWTLPDRFFALWALWALFLLLLLPGLTNAHAVLLAVPLCGLASGLLKSSFIDDRRHSLWAEAESEAGDDLAALYRPSAGRWILAVIVFALLLLTTVHLQTISREVLQVLDGSPSGFFTRLQSNAVFVDVRIGVLWAFIGAMFLLVGFFLAAGIWGNRTTLQGYLFGLLLFIIITQTSAGWYTAVFNANEATESWDKPTTAQGYRMLSETLNDFMLRETMGFPMLPIAVVRDPFSNTTEDGLLGWLLKDQPVEFVDTIDQARAKPFVIIPDTYTSETLTPDLGGSYVGQRFVLAKAWSPTTLLGADVLPWWFQRQTRSDPYAIQSVTLWVRQDVFESLPVSPLLPPR